jgi:DNA adenine methylase
MKPLFCRIGSKTLMSDDIISYFPKHSIYVEPFIGGGGVYFKKEPSPIEVINDIDKNLIQGYRLIKRAPIDLSLYTKDLNTIPKIKAFLVSNKNTNADKLTKEIIYNCNGFNSNPISRTKNNVYKNTNPYSKLKDIKDYKKRIKNTIIKNTDYKEIVKKYDSKETLFYLDPPYENSDKSKIYKNNVLDYEELAFILKQIKGKFLLSINGSINIIKIFKDFKIRTLQLKTIAHKGHILGGKPRVELLISNF